MPQQRLGIKPLIGSSSSLVRSIPGSPEASPQQSPRLLTGSGQPPDAARRPGRAAAPHLAVARRSLAPEDIAESALQRSFSLSSPPTNPVDSTDAFPQLPAQTHHLLLEDPCDGGGGGVDAIEVDYDYLQRADRSDDDDDGFDELTATGAPMPSFAQRSDGDDHAFGATHAMMLPSTRAPAHYGRGRDAIDELLPHSVYISGLRGAQNTALLAELGVTAFLNVAVDVPMPEHVLARAPGPSTVLDARLVAEVAAAGGASGGGGVYEYLHLPLRDKGDEVLADHFTSAFAFIRGCRSEQRRVLLFCREGKSRSGSIAIAFIMDECRLTYDDASEYVKRCRSVVDPNISFCSQLSNAAVQQLPHDNEDDA